MDASFFNKSYLDKMFLFKNEENIFVENTDAQSDEKSPDVEGFLSSDVLNKKTFIGWRNK